MVAPSFTPGQTLGHFRLIEEIGAGGMGIVYRARDTRLERDVAVKVLNAKTLSDASARKRFRREALILSRLNHPNVESVYDFHSEQGVDYLVLEYVPGTSLNERLERGALSEKEVLALGIQLARGLAAAHAQRVVHRDLKPGNLRVTPENVLKILDFGLAQLYALPEDKTITTDETEVLQDPFAGTPAYLSPEQIKLKEPDIRSDIYSAGVVLYEMATGSQPFPQRGQMLADAILHSVPPAPRTKNKDISLGLEVVILKCMEKDPKLRYQSASELLDHLEELARGSGPQQPIAVRREPPSRRRRFLRYVVSGLVLTMILICLELLFENFTIVGQEFRLTGYRLIQHRLSSALSGPLPVTVVDISDLEPKLVAGTDSKATPRRELQQMLGIISDQSPSAIGIDIDFSPDKNGWIDPVHDPQFFETCLTLKSPSDRHIPVYLGVNRSQILGPDYWLGNERYEPLAASIIIPRDARTMVTELQIPGSPKPLLSLATRLAAAYRGQQSIPFWARWGQSLGLLESLSQSDLQGVHVKELMIDYAPRFLLQKEKIRYGQLQSLGADQARERLFHKIVVVGAAELDKTNDVFSVMDEPTPGPIIIACAAYTLVQSAPLYELTLAGNILTSLALSAVVFFLVGGLWYSQPGKRLDVERLRAVCTLLVAAAVLLAGVLFVRHTHVAWDGFVIVLLALALCRQFESVIEWLRGALPKAKGIGRVNEGA